MIKIQGLDKYFNKGSLEEKGKAFAQNIVAPLFFNPMCGGISPFYLYVNVTTPETLRKVLANPEKYAPSGVYIMRILAVGYIAVAVTQSLSGVMRGAGDTMTPMWISIVQTIVIRVPLAYTLVNLTKSAANPDGRPECLFASLLISWVLGAVLTGIFYKRGKWKKGAL